MEMNEELVNVIRLALSGKESDLRLYLAKHIRKLRKTDPQSAQKLEDLLKSQPARSHNVMRKEFLEAGSTLDLNTDNHGGLPLIKKMEFIDSVDEPFLQSHVKGELEQVLIERNSLELLASRGLYPTRSLIFQGPPGVGKTMTAQWLASKLELPLYTLDLTAVMSSYLGKTGSNLRAVIDYAKSHPCILLLDEIDAIAKKRTDEADVGELKRLVTVMLQELEIWPDQGLLIAATNHPELVDPALWRRFDMEITFQLPTQAQVEKAVIRFVGEDKDNFAPWHSLLVDSLTGKSYSHIKRVVFQLRRLMLIKPESFDGEIINYLQPDLESRSRTERIIFAVKLVKNFNFTQQKAAQIAQVSRDTIRKKLLENRSNII
ncbi:ATP-binding protein [Yersinia ruckeri]|uniref:AAA family ATPase n=1 Tax=Yersinia ruckeri TaxID=29486 RepID=UPI0020BF9406|nr:ATP-binding protein [Yersinia ruckeri]MCK8563813.1 ATP-binding protein [Yersinia ruckeri]UZY17558.1 ATP-binding protein [Yersinia ruckeri]